MSDLSTVKVETAFNVTEFLHKQDDDRVGSNLTKLFMPGFAIFALYIIIGASALYPLFSPQIRKFLESNLLIRHLLGFFSLLFFVVLSGAKDVDYRHTIVFTVLVYAWFLLTTKLEIHFWVTVISIFAILYALELYKQTKDIPHKEKKIITDVEYGGTILAFLVTIFGFVTYYYEKSDQLKGAFRHDHFFLGKYD